MSWNHFLIRYRMTCAPPLRAIIGFVDIIQEEFRKEVSPELSNYLSTISRNAVKMAQMIDDLLTFSRATRKTVYHERVDMDRLLRSTFDQIIACCPKRQVRLITKGTDY